MEPSSWSGAELWVAKLWAAELCLPSSGLPSSGLPSSGLPSSGLPSSGLPSSVCRAARAPRPALFFLSRQAVKRCDSRLRHALQAAQCTHQKRNQIALQGVQSFFSFDCLKSAGVSSRIILRQRAVKSLAEDKNTATFASISRPKPSQLLLETTEDH